VLFRSLEKAADLEKIDVADVKRSLGAVANRTNTMQTMIFEPAKLRVYVAIGKCPSTDGELKLLDLGPLFKKK